MSLAGVALAVQYVGGDATRTEYREQIGLAKAAPLHQVSEHLVRRQLGQLNSIVVILDEPFEQVEQSLFFRAG